MAPSRTFSGIDRLSAIFNAIGSGVVFGFIAAVAPAQLRPSAILTGVLVTALFAAARYRLRIGPDAIFLEQLIGWVIPVKRQRYELDAEPDLYQSWEADAPEGLCIKPILRDGEPPESDCFGPSEPAALSRLMEAAGVALDEARRALPPTPRELRCPLLAHADGCFELELAERSPQGRIRRLRSSRPVDLLEVEIPRGSIFELNPERFLIPSREDLLVAVQLAAPVRLPGGLEVPTESRLSVDAQGRITAVKGPLGPEVEVGGLFLDGRELIAFDASGRARNFTLARAHRFGPVTVPASSSFIEWPEVGGLERRWSCVLGGTAPVGGVELRAGEGIHFDVTGERVLAIDPKRDLVIEGQTLGHGTGALPTRSDGRVDLKAAKKRGLLKRS